MDELLGLLGPAVRTAAPILLAALGGVFTQRAGIFNIGLEGYMLSAAFAAVLTASLTGSPLAGLAAGVLAGVAVALLMAFLVLTLQADEIIVGIAVNLLAAGLTAYLLQELTPGGGVLQVDRGLPTLDSAALGAVPVVGDVLNGQSVLVLAALLLVPVVAWVLGRSPFGLALRAVGEHPDAARSAGVSVDGTRYLAFALSGAFCGLGGVQLALGFLRLFSMDMTAGRGIIAFAAVIFGGAAAGLVSVGALLFGFAEALANRLQTRDLPTQVVLMLPYLATILVLLLPRLRAALRRRGASGAVAPASEAAEAQAVDRELAGPERPDEQAVTRERG